MSSCFRRREHRKIEPLRLRGWPGVTPSMMGGTVHVCFGSLTDTEVQIADVRFTFQQRTYVASASTSAKCHKRTCTLGVIVEPTLLADFRAKSPVKAVTLGVTPK